MTMNVDEEIEKLKEEIARLGQVQPDGSISVSSLSLPLPFRGAFPSAPNEEVDKALALLAFYFTGICHSATKNI